MGERIKTFTIAGRRYTVSANEVTESLQGVHPQRVARYFIPVNGRRYPLKQAFSVATGAPPVAFTSQTAYRVLTGLGFDVGDEGA